MKKITRLMILILACALWAAPAVAQEGSSVAVMPFVLSAEGAQLEQLSRLSKGLVGVVVENLADQGLTAFPLGDNYLSSDEETVKAQAREMGADYLFQTRVNKVGERFNLTGQLVALNASGRSSDRVLVTADNSL
ncbi:MAG: hypothetical protein LBV79_09530, partial [Candidatus Adiutrix sp.]|nr:hypothetical protein [Candidatus Adiutrix sp.]